MKINFVKMHSDGNDFVIIKNDEKNISYKKDKIKKLSHRNKGVGFDQFIVIEKSLNADAFMRIYNNDGNQVEMCGNAARCVAALLFSTKNKNSVVIETISSILMANLLNDGNISISIKIPEQVPEAFNLKENINIKCVDFSDIQKDLNKGHIVNMGNPHIVFVVPSIQEINLNKYGKKIEKSPLFKDNINVEIVEVISKNELKVKFWERGAGLTLSCGSGVLPSFYSCHKKKLCNDQTKILLPGGIVSASIKKNILTITGKAEASYLGEFNYE